MNSRCSYIAVILTTITLFVVMFGVLAPTAYAQETPIRWVPGEDGYPGVGVLVNTLEAPCRIGEEGLEPRGVSFGPGRLGSDAGEVPVHDDDLNYNLVQLITAIQRSYEFSEFQDGDVQRTAEYLRLLCEKEYEEDHALQHAWANLIGDFVAETQDFIVRGYNDNPAFLTNQYVYYQLVALSTARTFAEDIALSDIDANTQRTILRSILDGLFDSNFPYISGDGTVLADDTSSDLLSTEFYGGGGGWAGFNQFFLTPQNNESSVVSLALSDLNRRIETQLEYEREKLDWGRGFFSYEICDLTLFTDTDLDRRNCRIATPGSLIQDQTSFVFGSALRQMELNDEYEEWIAPNTLAVLSDTLSYRTLDLRPEGITRIPEGQPDDGGLPNRVSTNATSPVDIQDDTSDAFVQIESVDRIDDFDLDDDPYDREFDVSPVTLPWVFDINQTDSFADANENFIPDACEVPTAGGGMRLSDECADLGAFEAISIDIIEDFYPVID